MTLTEQLLAAVEASGADAGKVAVLEAFLQSAEPVIETLGPSAFQDLLHAAAQGNIPDAVVNTLTAGQVDALLAQTQGELAVITENHEAQAAAWNAAISQLEIAALAALARVLIGAI